MPEISRDKNKASFKSLVLGGHDSNVKLGYAPYNSESVARFHRANYSNYSSGRGFAFFIDSLSKPKLHVYASPSLEGWKIDHTFRHFRVIVENVGRSPIIGLSATVTTIGPFEPEFESDKTKVFGKQGLNILNHRWPPALFSPYDKLALINHPAVQKKSEVELHRKNPFGIYLLTMTASKTTHCLQTGDYEEIDLRKDIRFRYFDAPNISGTYDLEIDFYLDFEGKTKSGDSVQSKKRFRISVPDFGKIGICDLERATITELKDNRSKLTL